MTDTDTNSNDGRNSLNTIMCRICHCEEISEEFLITPCYCSGTLRYVHQKCLQQWLKSNGIKSCELCKFEFIMQTKIRPFKNWEKLDMNGIEKRKILCSVTFHLIALTCVIWSLYVLIDKTHDEFKQTNNQNGSGGQGVLDWTFWTKLVVVAIGFTGGIVFMYIQCKMYFQLCNRWRQYNRIILIQPITEEILKKSRKIMLEKNNFTTKNTNNETKQIMNNNLKPTILLTNEENTMLLVNNNLNQISQINNNNNNNNNNSNTNEQIELIIPDIIK